MSEDNVGNIGMWKKVFKHYLLRINEVYWNGYISAFHVLASKCCSCLFLFSSPSCMLLSSYPPSSIIPALHSSFDMLPQIPHLRPRSSPIKPSSWRSSFCLHSLHFHSCHSLCLLLSHTHSPRPLCPSSSPYTLFLPSQPLTNQRLILKSYLLQLGGGNKKD